MIPGRPRLNRSGAGRVQAWMSLMGSRIAQIAERIEDDEVERLLGAIRGARRIYVMGAGRSGLVAKGFAMRLMHLGLSSFVVGETITPSFTPRSDGRPLRIREDQDRR